MFHGYKTYARKHTQTHVCLPVYSEPVCVCVSRRETQIFLLGSQHSGFLLASLCTAVLAYLSFPPILNTGTLPAALIWPATLMCAHSDPGEPACSLFFSPILIKPQPSPASLFFLSFCCFESCSGAMRRFS